MKVYLTSKEHETHGHLHVSHIHQFQNIVLDKEANSITVDCFLTSSSLNELDKLLEIIMNKMRIGCELIIIDHDIDVLCLKYYRNEIDIETINEEIFGTNTKSFVNFELILSKIESIASRLGLGVETQEKYIDLNSAMFTLKTRRIT